MHKVTVADYVAKHLKSIGVKYVFGYQGGAVLKLLDAIDRCIGIEFKQNYNEQSSAFCADAYSRVSGNLGVAVATSGPGATNLVTGIANAQLDSIPVLFITGQEFTHRIKKRGSDIRSNGFQDVDITSITKPITKYSVLLEDENNVAYELEKAISIAKNGRPGAVHIDIPIDIQFKEIDIDQLRHYKEAEQDFGHGTDENIVRLIEMLRGASRPIILAGGGITLSNSKNLLREFVDLTKVPVVLTLNGLDCYEDFYGFSGIYGKSWANNAVLESDLLIVLGARLGQHQVGKKKSEFTNGDVVHVDVDLNELNRVFPEQLSINVDLFTFFNKINPILKSLKLEDKRFWHNQKKEDPQNLYYNDSWLGVNSTLPSKFISEIQKYFTPSSVTTVDVGENQMWVAQTIRPKFNQRVLNSSGLGAMGYALPAAIGAKMLRPDDLVICIMGDGGFQINMTELQFIKNWNINIKVVVFNNEALGMIKASQQRYFQSRAVGSESPAYSCVCIDKIAYAYDLEYHKVISTDDFLALENIFGSSRSAIIEVVINSDTRLRTRYDL